MTLMFFDNALINRREDAKHTNA